MSSPTGGLESWPLSTPPPAVTPNFVNPDSIAWEVNLTAGICFTLILLFTAVRFYAKVFLTRAYTLDDCQYTSSPASKDLP